MTIEEKSNTAEKLIDQIISADEKLIKSKARVQENGEVFTPRNIVKDMLDLDGVNEYSYELDKTFLEPACGNGNFLIQIEARKLASVSMEKFDTDCFRAISTIYGVDIDQENIRESRERMMAALELFYSDNEMEMSDDMRKTFKFVLARNIILGNTLEFSHKREESSSDTTERVAKGGKRIKNVKSELDTRNDGPMVISEWVITDDMVIRKEILMKEIAESHNDNYIYEYSPMNISDIHNQKDYDFNRNVDE